jgi:hypothetical protein
MHGQRISMCAENLSQLRIQSGRIEGTITCGFHGARRLSVIEIPGFRKAIPTSASAIAQVPKLTLQPLDLLGLRFERIGRPAEYALMRASMAGPIATCAVSTQPLCQRGGVSHTACA